MNYKETLDGLVNEGWLISQVHPTLDLTIYNYSQKTQYEGHWTADTLAARGLVLNSKGKVVARPFGKFFNASEVPGQIPDLPFEVYEKMDGSLGIFFWYSSDDTQKLEPVFASRGSFTSEQAVKGWELLKKLPYHSLAYGYTHMFEIIYPENRIVVDYGKKEGLVLLGVIHTNSGRELPYRDIEDHLGSSFEMVKCYNITENWNHLVTLNEPNREGFVIRFSNGYRVKVKFEEYVRLHRIITQVSTIDIWERLKNNEPLDKLIEKVPDEFHTWVKETVRDLVVRYENIERDYRQVYTEITSYMHTVDRRQFAEAAKRYPLSGVLFNMLDGKNYSDAIWKKIRPEWSKPFKTDAIHG
jgi:T4 RnlA family RNA ligase